MPDLRVMVVDDEPLVRRGMERFLSSQPGVELLPQAKNGLEAVELIEEHGPDLVFLDVQMPEMDGFEVLANLEERALPAVVFVTAYDQYALQAFEVHAVDYLLKPFDDDRLATALRRARARLEAPHDGLDQRVAALLAELRNNQSHVERFMVRTAGRIYFVDVDEVDWLEAAGNYVRLHVGDRQHLVRDTIKNLESRLDPKSFIRIHRSAMINVVRVQEVRSLPSGDCYVVLTNGTSVRLSRGYREMFERTMMGT